MQEQNSIWKNVPGRVFYVSSPDDHTVLIAMRLQYTESRVRWFDTIKERDMGIRKMIDSDHDTFVFERSQAEGGGVYTFKPLTLELYDQNVKSRTLLPKSFSVLEDLLSAYEETVRTQW